VQGELHVPPTQFWPPEQTVPQVPQWPLVVMRSTSQPSALEPLQSAKCALQVSEHAPAVHAGVAFAVPQAVPQVAQLLTSVAVSVVHPVPVFPQSWNGAVQVYPQEPPTQSGVAFV
jgi:hypothetical protein